MAVEVAQNSISDSIRPRGIVARHGWNGSLAQYNLWALPMRQRPHGDQRGEIRLGIPELTTTDGASARITRRRPGIA